MESFEAVVRTILARIRAHQIPRHVPTVEEVLPSRASGRQVYRAPSTAWGTAAGSAVPASRFPHLDPARQPAQPRPAQDRRRSSEELRLPSANEMPTPRGLLACDPRKRS